MTEDDEPRAGRFLAAYPVLLLVLSVIHAAAPQRDGLLALSQILAPLLFVPLPPVAVLAWRRFDSVELRVAVVAALVVAIVRFGPSAVSPPAIGAGGSQLGVTSWNLRAGAPATPTMLETLAAVRSEVVVLQELTPEQAAAIVEDRALAERFPYRVLFPRDGVLGMGVLATSFLRPGERPTDPPLLVVELDLADGTTVTIVNAHPLPAGIPSATPLRIPVGFDPVRRDASIRAIRAVVDPLVEAGRPLILVGDFNVTTREPAYGELSRGLLDAWSERGIGLGATWRPGSLKGLPLGLLRIDFAFSGGGLEPVRAGVDCWPRGSDHCLLSAAFAVR